MISKNATAKEVHDSVDDIAKNQNMGDVGSRRGMWYDSRNWGSGVKTNYAKKEPTYASPEPGLAKVNGNGSEPITGSKSTFDGPKNTPIESYLDGILGIWGIF